MFHQIYILKSSITAVILQDCSRKITEFLPKFQPVGVEQEYKLVHLVGSEDRKNLLYDCQER